MHVTIRIATKDDLTKIKELNVKLFEKEHKEYDDTLICDWPFSKEGHKYFKHRIMRKEGFVVIAEDKGKPVGYLCGGLHYGEAFRNLSKMAELENTFVLKEYRSKGIGTKMFQAFLEWCRENNYERLTVQASAQNKKAIKFYHNHGFEDRTLTLETDIKQNSD